MIDFLIFWAQMAWLIASTIALAAVLTMLAIRVLLAFIDKFWPL